MNQSLTKNREMRVEQLLPKLWGLTNKTDRMT